VHLPFARSTTDDDADHGRKMGALFLANSP